MSPGEGWRSARWARRVTDATEPHQASDPSGTP